MSIQPARRKVFKTLAALYFILPFIVIGGKSVLRFDVPGMRLQVLGAEVWMQEFILVLLAIMFLVSLFLLVTLLYGRVWCGWICPQTIFTELTPFLNKLSGKMFSRKFSAHLKLFFVSLVFGFISVCYVVSPYDAIPALLQGTLGPVATGSTLIIALFTYVNFVFIRRTFCATICPYAKFQSAITDDKSLLIQQNPGRVAECLDRSCLCSVRICPTNIDIREGMQIGCVMCGRCIDTCGKVMAGKLKTGLIQYSYGVSGIKSRLELIRPATITLALVCLFTLSFFTYKSMTRASFEFSVLSHPMEARLSKKGDVINAYILSVKNKRQDDISLQLSLRSEETTSVRFSHNINEALYVAGGQVDKIPLFVRSKGKPKEDIQLNISFTAEGNVPESHTKSAYFNVPE
jgi:cytochrome c oxidase accessory protein FixG